MVAEAACSRRWVGEVYLNDFSLFGAENSLVCALVSVISFCVHEMNCIALSALQVRGALDGPEVSFASDARAKGAGVRFLTGMSVLDREKAMLMQDSVFFLPRLLEGLNFVNENIAVYPLWICKQTAAVFAVVRG